MTATDRLRRMLDERGVEWGNVRNDGYESDYLTKWRINGIQGHAFVTVTEWPGGLTLETLQRCPTPEQAVAATLGGAGTEEGSTVGSKVRGKLTAEQVRKAIFIGSVWDEESATYLVNRTDMQQIADELNAVLGDGESEVLWNEHEGTFHCSSCDTLLTNEISIEWPSHKVTPITLPNYCPNCGKAVKR